MVVKNKTSTAEQQRYREIIAKAMHDNGSCGFDYGSWNTMVQSGYECGCYEMTDWIIAALPDAVTVADELIRVEVQSLPSFGILKKSPFDYMISRNQVLAILDKYATKRRNKRASGR